MTYRRLLTLGLVFLFVGCARPHWSDLAAAQDCWPLGPFPEGNCIACIGECAVDHRTCLRNCAGMGPHQNECDRIYRACSDWCVSPANDPACQFGPVMPR